MRISRIFEDLEGHERYSSLVSQDFIELLARHKALLLRSDDDEHPWNVDDFAQLIEGLKLTRYEYVGGAGTLAQDNKYSFVLFLFAFDLTI